MEKIIEDYEQFLKQSYKLNTCKSKIARIKRIDKYCNILSEYSLDKC